MCVSEENMGVCVGESGRVRGNVCERGCVSVWQMCVYVCFRGRLCACVCDREGQHVCVCVSESVCVCVYV